MINKNKMLMGMLLSFTLLVPLSAYAGSITIDSDPCHLGSSPAPCAAIPFFIPLKAATSGTFNFNDPTGYGRTSDSVSLDPEGGSSGYLDFSFIFSPIPDGNYNSALLEISFEDLDLLPYDISKVHFFETAQLKVDGNIIADLNETYAMTQGIVETNNTQINLSFDLFSAPFQINPLSFPNPLTLDLRLRTDLVNNRPVCTSWKKRGCGSITLTNTQESIISAQLLLDVTPVPEPSTIILLGSGLLGLIVSRRKLARV